MGLRDDADALSLNNYCVSGLTAIGLAHARLKIGDAKIVLAGGVEMMSRVGFMADNASYYVDETLPPAKRYVTVAASADRLAYEYAITRQDMDSVTARSHDLAIRAESNPALIASRINMIAGDQSLALAREESPRDNMTLERLAAMPPAFRDLAQSHSTALESEFPAAMTIAHAPPMADGAGLALLGLDRARARARIVSYASVGGNTRDSLLAGFSAMEKALGQAQLTLRDMDRVEFMEAFAPVIVKFLRDYPVDPDRVNVGGGHLAKGHPMGATGAILLSSLLDAVDAADGRFGLVVASGASGIGAAMIVERLRPGV
jgi:acetyl-CoA C-acetyltransferase/acetyl-CoA acyltransferase